MTKPLFSLALSFFALKAHAQIAVPAVMKSPQTKAEYCAYAKSPAQFVALSAQTEARIAFDNPYGYFSTGLCWWHSHLQRSSVYLAYYLPNAPKPTAMQAYRILKNIYFSHRVTAIPGYNNFYEFTLDNQKVATNFLSDVEIIATASGDWVHGVVGASAVTAANLKLKMDQLYAIYKSHPALIYQMLQMPGFDAHAWLVQSISPSQNGGYSLSVIDSNFPSKNYAYEYTVGQKQFAYPDDATASFVPYTYDQKQIVAFASAASSFCK